MLLHVCYEDIYIVYKNKGTSDQRPCIKISQHVTYMYISMHRAFDQRYMHIPLFLKHLLYIRDR